MSAADDQISDARNRMLGSVPGAPALGRGPAPDGGFSRHEYDHPAAGWGAPRSVGHVLETRGTPAEGIRALFVMNQEDGGFDCPGCAWPDDPTGLHLDICENGVKHVTWELTRKQVGGDFFATHTVAELSGWSDYDLEDAGRLSEPMRYDAASDRYVPVSWEDAFELVGSTLRGLDSPHQAAFYPHGFRITQPARMRGFLTPSGRAEFGLAPLPGDTDPAEGRLMLATVRSHDQFNTTIYSNDDRYRGLKGLRTVVFMNSGDMKDRGLGEFDLVDITSFSRDGSRRTVYGYRAIRYEVPRGCAAGYMPELNVLCGIADYSTQSGQPVTKHLEVEVTPAREKGAGQ